MGLVAAKCTNCGGQIEVDSTKEAGICKHCGTAFITEKAISNYTTINNVTNHITKIINGKEVEDGEDFYSRAMSHFKLEEYSNARDAITKAIKNNPDNAEFRYAEILIETKNFTEFKNLASEKRIDNILKLASNEQKEKWTKETGFDFTKTRNDFFAGIFKQAISTLNFTMVDFDDCFDLNFNKEQINTIFSDSKTKLIKYIEELNEHEEDYEQKLIDLEDLLTVAIRNKAFSYQEQCEIVSAYLDITVDPSSKFLYINDNNFTLFMKEEGFLYVPYQQVENVDISYKKTKRKKDYFPEGFYVTPNIKNVEELEKFELTIFDAVVCLDYDDDDKEILPRLYNVSKLSINNKKSIAKPKKKSKILEFLSDFKFGIGQALLLAVGAFGGLCIVLPIVGIIFNFVESNDLWPWVFKVNGIITAIVFTITLIYQIISTRIATKKIKEGTLYSKNKKDKKK